MPRLGFVLVVVLCAMGSLLVAQSPVTSSDATPEPAWCAAVTGDRSSGGSRRDARKSWRGTAW